ncbi:Hypothetical predicted protein [Mytilus galloprovincialis]|uniref:Methyltransferase FkbM domain-containing protein n=1 Tax=Mytilus galloprovincialis TaxID=29158 RepID=A0A8B6EX04_MYTGA|nr:Hypothetical predicted protein [Mytilus galloprovincialis]
MVLTSFISKFMFVENKTFQRRQSESAFQTKSTTQTSTKDSMLTPESTQLEQHTDHKIDTKNHHSKSSQSLSVTIRSRLQNLSDPGSHGNNLHDCQKIQMKRADVLSLTDREKKRLTICVSNYLLDYNKGNEIWTGNKAEIRWNNHTFLNDRSSVLDIGGNTGIDASHIISLFKPMRYIILEPLKRYYNHLVNTFSSEHMVEVYQFGVGKQNAKLDISIRGPNGEGSSVFMRGPNGEGSSVFINQTSNKKTTIQIFNITHIFIRLGFSCENQLDLMTINCEGCEFEVIEELQKTNILNYIKNIQFATHSTLKYLKEPKYRYCRIQELLSRTHMLSYQYKFIWESWKRRDLVKLY